MYVSPYGVLGKGLRVDCRLFLVTPLRLGAASGKAGRLVEGKWTYCKPATCGIFLPPLINCC